MATNRKFEHGSPLSVVCSDPTTPVSGAPVRVGRITGVAITDERADGSTSVDFAQAVYLLSVKGVDNDGNVAVAAGDPIFYVDADTPKLSKKAAGYFFGYALEAVSSGATTTIQVLQVPGGTPGSSDISVGSVGKEDLPAAFLQVDLLDGVDETMTPTYALAAMAELDELVFVGRFTTKAAIATLVDRTADFDSDAGALGVIANATNETNNQLIVIWVDRT